MCRSGTEPGWGRTPIEAAMGKVTTHGMESGARAAPTSTGAARRTYPGRGALRGAGGRLVESLVNDAETTTLMPQPRRTQAQRRPAQAQPRSAQAEPRRPRL